MGRRERDGKREWVGKGVGRARLGYLSRAPESLVTPLHEPDRSLYASVPELDGIVPSAGEEDVRVGRVIDTSEHSVVMSVNAVEVAA